LDKVIVLTNRLHIMLIPKKKGHRVGVVHIHLVRQAVSAAYKPAVAVLL
jgi:hypothetical protein